MYSDKEIKKIISRAYELQNRSEGSTQATDTEQKLSLEEIEEVAKEAGVSAEYVRQAAIEFEGVPVEEPFFLDTDKTCEIELVGFAKGDLTKKTWAELRSIIEYHFDSPGQVKRRPKGIVWKAQPKGVLKVLHTRKSPVVEVSSTGTKTTIRIKQDLKTIHRLLLYPAYAALAGAAVVAGISLVEGPEGFFFSAGLLAVAKLFHSWSNRKTSKARKKLKDLTEQLQTIVTRRFTAAENRELDLDKEEQEQITPDELKEEKPSEFDTSSHREKTIG